MTGIERLRELAGDFTHCRLWYVLISGTEERWGCHRGDDRTVSDELLSIADQIERERACDADTIENIRLIVGVVIDDMERHILGHEGMEDSPVARWARELREALGGDGRDRAADVSASAYDLLPQEDREALAWVREHGGLDAVERRWECLSYYADPVPRSCMEKRLARLQRQIDESHAALRRRREIISKLGHRVSDLTNENAELRRRAMPEGYQWPRYKDGELVQIGAMFAEKGTIKNVVASVELSDDWFAVHGFDGAIDKYSKGERVKRPAVPGADGEPLEVGQTVWDANGDELVVVALEDGGNTVTCRYADVGDGIPTHGMWSPSQLTHTKPEIDTWQRIEEDAGCTATKYNERRGTIFTTKQQVARDLVRRCRALAERERGE